MKHRTKDRIRINIRMAVIIEDGELKQTLITYSVKFARKQKEVDAPEK